MKYLIASTILAFSTLSNATPTGQKQVLPEFSIQVFSKVSSIEEARGKYLDEDVSRMSVIKNQCHASNCSIVKNTAELEFGFSPSPVCYFPEGFELELEIRATQVRDFNCK